MKELFVSSLTEWIATAGKTRMDEVIVEQLGFLRAQLKDGSRTEQQKAGEN